MQNDSLNKLIKCSLIFFLGLLLLSSMEIIHYILRNFYEDIRCEYHYHIFLNIEHKAQHTEFIKYYFLAFIGLLGYTLFFQIKNKNHVIFYMNVMIYLLLGCLLHDILMRSPINSFSKFVSHFFNGSFLLTCLNLVVVVLISTFSTKKMLQFMLTSCLGFLINIIAFLIYFLFYEFMFGTTSVYIFIFIFIFGIFQFNIMLICEFLKRNK